MDPEVIEPKFKADSVHIEESSTLFDEWAIKYLARVVSACPRVGGQVDRRGR